VPCNNLLYRQVASSSITKLPKLLQVHSIRRRSVGKLNRSQGVSFLVGCRKKKIKKLFLSLYMKQAVRLHKIVYEVNSLFRLSSSLRKYGVSAIKFSRKAVKPGLLIRDVKVFYKGRGVFQKKIYLAKRGGASDTSKD
jgi:hypothetical protein